MTSGDDKDKRNTRIPALIRRLGEANDNEVLQAARALVRELADNGAHLDDLAQAWERAQAQRPVPVKTKPFDFDKVTAAVTLYAQNKTTVTVNKTLKAVKEMIADCPVGDPQHMVFRYAVAQLRALGFKRSRSGASYSKPQSASEP